MGAQTQQIQQAARDRAASDAYYRGEAPAGAPAGGPAPLPTPGAAPAPAAPGGAPAAPGAPSIAGTAAKTGWLAQAAELGLSQQEAVRVAMMPYDQRSEVVKQLMLRQQERRSRYDVVESADGSKERVYGDGRREGILGPQPKPLDPNQTATQEAELRKEYLGNEAVKGFNQAQRSFSTMTDLVKRANEAKPGAGVNDTAEEAEGVSMLAKPLKAKINVIPYNPIAEYPEKAPTREAAEDFCRELENRGLRVTLRQTAGREIDAACGQLRLDRERAEE
jgi:hypothetical protein